MAHPNYLVRRQHLYSFYNLDKLLIWSARCPYFLCLYPTQARLLLLCPFSVFVRNQKTRLYNKGIDVNIGYH